MALLTAVKAGIFVVQAAGNTGPAPRSVSSFSPWIFTVGAASHDRVYNNLISLGNNVTLSGAGLACKSKNFQYAFYVSFNFAKSSTQLVAAPLSVNGQILGLYYFLSAQFSVIQLYHYIGCFHCWMLLLRCMENIHRLRDKVLRELEKQLFVINKGTIVLIELRKCLLQSRIEHWNKWWSHQHIRGCGSGITNRDFPRYLKRMVTTTLESYWTRAWGSTNIAWISSVICIFVTL